MIQYHDACDDTKKETFMRNDVVFSVKKRKKKCAWSTRKAGLSFFVLKRHQIFPHVLPHLSLIFLSHAHRLKTSKIKLENVWN